MFTHALTNTNSRRDQTVMIGDSWEADIVGAYNSCIDQIWFNPMRKMHLNLNQPLRYILSKR